MSYTEVTVEGGLLPADLLERIGDGDAEGQRPEDFALGSGVRLSDAIQGAFSDARSYWDTFERRHARGRESLTSLTRDTWVLPLLKDTLGFELSFQRPATVIGGQTYAISHQAGEGEGAPPVHIVSIDQPLDRRDGSLRSPHALVQEYLNRSDALWGIVTNGERLRLLRDSARLSRPSFVEFDLRGIVDGNMYSEFVPLFRLLHRSRLPRDVADGPHCLLERYYQQGVDEGGRVREHLRDGVEKAIVELGNALLIHPRSEALRETLQSGQLQAEDYYRQLLRLIYRLLFLYVSEERRLIFPLDTQHAHLHEIYSRDYSLRRLRDRCERPFAGDRYSDLWHGVLQTFAVFREQALAERLGLSALNGELFGPSACRDIENAGCENASLLRAVYHLSTFEDGKARRRVNYAALDVEELGSVYESLLDFRPHVELGERPAFELVSGGERKQTGSYYTPPSLVHELIDSALVPVVEEKLNAAKSIGEKEQALLGLRVCDPASGSGHFLLAAARRIARELAKLRTGEAEPAPEPYRQALRDVIRSCIYAVDKNPLAVDLCKVALWIEGHNAGLPLSFLDNHIKCGDSLVGVFDLGNLEAGIPDEAYAAVTGDDKELTAALRKRNKAEREGQMRLGTAHAALPATIANQFKALGELDERDPGNVRTKETLYITLRSGPDWWTLKTACDLWTNAFFATKRPESSHLVPTTDALRTCLRGVSVDQQMRSEANAASQRMVAFHWPLEFPEVFESGGFDVVLGNPPWEKIALEDAQFFAASDSKIARATSKSVRKRMIGSLQQSDPRSFRAYEDAQSLHDHLSTFLRQSGRYPLTGFRRINLYSVFAELGVGAVHDQGTVGFVLASGIATDETNARFFVSLSSSYRILSIYDFENRKPLFPGVHRMYHFCLFTVGGPKIGRQADIAFGLLDPSELPDKSKHFTLSPSSLQLLSPLTGTCPAFASTRDVELGVRIYSANRACCLHADDQSWPGRPITPFNMSNDSSLFVRRPALESPASINSIDRTTLLPIYESKLINQFNHRFASFSGVSEHDVEVGNPTEQTTQQLKDPSERIEGRYWLDAAHLGAKFPGNWFLGYRDVTNAANERTSIAALIPAVPCVHSLILLRQLSPYTASYMCSVMNSFVYDYCARQKVTGLHLNQTIWKQLPLPNYHSVRSFDSWLGQDSPTGGIAARVLELTYTAWDMQPFARDLGYSGTPFVWDEERRFLLRCELDAAFFHLYGIERDDVDYIMETFPIAKRHDERQHGEYRTKRVILETYDAMQRAIDTGEPYQTRLDPPPADPRVAHSVPPEEGQLLRVAEEKGDYNES